jgi:hypothetical protein
MNGLSMEITEDMEITEAVARKVLTVVDAGLVSGVGAPIPGQMCVEAAVCYALGLPHGDEPVCVAGALRDFKIELNDARWSSPQARAKGLRRLAVAQLGSKDNLDKREFALRVSRLAIMTVVPAALRFAAKVHPEKKHKTALELAADRCVKEGTGDAADAAYDAAFAAARGAFAAFTYDAAYAAETAAAAYAYDDAAAAAAAVSYSTNEAAARAAFRADDAAASDKVLADFAEGVVQILVSMGAPGCRWLALTE